MTYNISFDIAAVMLLVVSMLGLVLTKDLKRRENKLFFAILFFSFLSGIFDILSASYLNGVMEGELGIAYFVTYAYTAIHNLQALLFFAYILLMSRGNLRILRKHGGLLLWPAVLGWLLIALQPFTSCMFYLDETGYHRNWGVYTVSFLGLVYLGVGTYYVLDYNRRIYARRTPVYLGYCLAAGLSLVIQLFIAPQVLIEIFMQSLAFWGMIYTIDDSASIYDPVNQIYNRKAFHLDMEVRMNSKESFGLFLVRIPEGNRFSKVMGENVLLELYAKELRGLVAGSKGGRWYELNGNTFAFDSRQRDTRWLEEVSQRAVQAFSRPWKAQGVEILPQAQLFAIRLPQDFASYETVVHIADQLHLETPYNQVMSGEDLKALQRQIQVEQAIERGLREDHFCVYYQPIWDRGSGLISSAEALIRLVDPILGFVPPDEFIPLAERDGTIVEIGEIVMRKVCQFYQSNQLESLGIRFIDVNLSVIQCMLGNIAETLEAIMEEYQVPARAINFEVTESVSWEKDPVVVQTIHKLRGIGSTFSLDDYGTGYSNLSAVVKMDFDHIKIDKSLLWGADHNEELNQILGDTIRTFQNLHCKIVVEGVETQEHKNKLVYLGCDYFQGYYWSRPVDEDSFLKYIRSFNQVQAS